MDFDWQNVAAIGIAAGAAFYLGRTVWKSWTSRSKPGCGTCGSCPSNAVKDTATIDGRPIVSLDLPRRSDEVDAQKNSRR